MKTSQGDPIKKVLLGILLKSVILFLYNFK